MNERGGACAAAVLLALAAFATGCNGAACDADELNEALAGAAPGETVEIGECEITGAFTVPNGVSVSGEGPGASKLRGTGSAPVLTLSGGTGTTRVSGLTIATPASAAIVATSAGGATFELAQLRVDATTGLGIGIEDAARVSATDVVVRGAITSDTLPPDPVPDPSTIPTVGLALVRVADASLTDTVVSGFGIAGVMVLQGAVDWVGGGASDNLTMGMRASGAVLRLERISLSRTLKGAGLVAFAGAFSDGCDVTTIDVDVSDSEGFGLVFDSSTGSHRDLVASGNEDVALYAYASTRFELAGSSSVLENNVAAAIVIVDSTGVVLSGARVDATRLGARLVSPLESAELGDGLEVARSTAESPELDITLRDIAFVDNARTGILMDGLGGAGTGIRLEGVTVSGEGEQLGCIVQDAGLEPGWDMGLVREGATVTNDALFDGRLEKVGLVMPPRFPPELMESGVGALL